MTWRYEVQHIATAVSMVQAGLGLTIVPRLAVDASGTPGVVARPLRNPTVTRTIGIVMKRGLPLSAAGQVLMELIDRHLSEEQ